jgi:hypothetical protein
MFIKPRTVSVPTAPIPITDTFILLLDPFRFTHFSALPAEDVAQLLGEPW